MVFKLMEGFQSHQKTIIPRNFKNVETKNDTENEKILWEHDHCLFNRYAEVDYSVLDNIPKHDTQHHMGKVPS